MKNVFMTNKEIFDYVHNYKTEYDEGFIKEEIEKITEFFGNKLNLDKFYDALTGITAIIIDKRIITFKDDIEIALRCGLNNRNISDVEFD